MRISAKRLGENVRRARERKGMSVEELAMSINERIDSVEKIEAGTTQEEMPLEVALSICFALDVTPDDLFEGIVINAG